MKIVITKQTVCDGKHVSIGDVIDATESSARFLIRIGKADTYSEPVIAKSENKDPEPLIDSRIKKAPSRAVSRPIKPTKKASKK